MQIAGGDSLRKCQRGEQKQLNCDCDEFSHHHKSFSVDGDPTFRRLSGRWPFGGRIEQARFRQGERRMVCTSERLAESSYIADENRVSKPDRCPEVGKE